MLGYRQRKVIIDSLLDFASYAFYYINIEVTYELLILEIIADNPSVDFGWMRLLSVFPIKVPEDENLRYIILI